MNKLIEELALDAGLLNYIDNETPRRYFINGHADLEEVEKFAELIVRECAEQIRMHAEFLENEYPNKYFDVTAVNCAELIEEHFGVEE